MIDLNRVKETYLVLSKLVKNDLNEEFLNNRIKGTEYANVYSNLMGIILQLSVKVPLDDRQSCLIQEQAQLTRRQTAQIDDSTLNELLKSQLYAWAEAFKSGELEDIPTAVTDDNIQSIYETLLDRIKNESWKDDKSCINEPTTQGVDIV